MQSVEIRVKGIIDLNWSEWFEGLQIRHGEDETILSGCVQDQAVIYGLMGKLRDLNLQVIAFSMQEAPPD